MNNEKKYTISQCYHCGNKGLMEVLCNHTERFGGPYLNSDGVVENDIEEQFHWIMLKCPVCRKVSLIQKYTDESMVDYATGDSEYIIDNVYPLNNFKLENVPNDIASSFKAALKIKDINKDLFLAGLRKVLELICKDKKAKGRGLNKKIDDMIQKSIFPKDMEVAYEVIRQAGNKAIHDKGYNLTKYDIEEVTSLLYSIINYLYIIPQKMVQLKSKINEESGEGII